MSGGVSRRSGWLRKIRSSGSGIARLLLLAFVLQLALPVLDLGGIAAQAGEAALRADLQSSLCHDPNEGSAPQSGAIPSAGIKHCIFCLPMAGNPVVELHTPLLIQPTLSADTIGIHAADDQIPASARPAFARSRAPPSSPRTV